MKYLPAIRGRLILKHMIDCKSKIIIQNNILIICLLISSIVCKKDEVAKNKLFKYKINCEISDTKITNSNIKYFQNIKTIISNNWTPPDKLNYNDEINNKYKPHEVKLVFVITRKGDVIHTQIMESEGIKSLNDSCVNAIKKTKNLYVFKWFRTLCQFY